MTADLPPGPGDRFARKPRKPRTEEDLEVPPRQAFDAELDAIIERVGRVVAGGRTAFVDGSPTYDAASMAIIRLAGLFEVRRFGPFLAGVAPGEQAVLAQGVGEVLRDAVAEHVRRLVAVEPRRDADAAHPGLRHRPGDQLLVQVERQRRPRADVGPEPGHRSEPVERLRERGRVGGEGAQVRGLHGPRPAAG